MNYDNTVAALKTGIPYTAEQMSQAIYGVLCDSQITDYAYGETDEESLEISWHNRFEQWQIIRRDSKGHPEINYDGLHETALAFEDPKLLLDMCERLDLVEELDELLEAAE